MADGCIANFLKELESGMLVLLEWHEFEDEDVPAILGSIAKVAKRKEESFRVMWNHKGLAVQL